MNIYARQGDLVIEKLTSAITGELQAGKNITLAGDSSGHPHVVAGPVKFRREDRVTFLMVAKSTTLAHKTEGGHPTVTLVKGEYRVYPLRERGDDGDRSVID